MSRVGRRAISPLQARMIEDMTARKLSPKTQTAHIRSCRRFAAWLGHSPETATADDVRGFQAELAGCDISNSTRNAIMTGVKFLFRVTLRRHDLAAEIYHLREPQKIPPIMSQDEVARLLANTPSIKARAMLSLAYGCGLRPGEVIRLRVGDIDSDRGIIRIVQSKGDKDRQVKLPVAVLEALRRYWPERSTKYDAGFRPEQRYLFPGRQPYEVGLRKRTEPIAQPGRTTPHLSMSLVGSVSRTYRRKEVRCCTRDEGGPLEAGGQAQASSHCKLLS